MDKIYCPYMDREINSSEASIEHVLPLSLGGSDEFTIRASKAFNSTLGHEIDGVIANDPIIGIERARRDVRGHNNRPVNVAWKKAVDEYGNPLQAVFDKGGLSLFDPKQRKMLTAHAPIDRSFQAAVRIEPYARIPFAAKVALATGHFLFGNVFRENAKHEDLRAVLKKWEKIPEDVLRTNEIRYFDPVLDEKADRRNPKHRIIELAIGNLNCSSVFVLFGNSTIGFSIGILGKWFATIFVPADDRAFPRDGLADFGHVLAVQGRKLKSGPFRALLAQIAAASADKPSTSDTDAGK